MNQCVMNVLGQGEREVYLELRGLGSGKSPELQGECVHSISEMRVRRNQILRVRPQVLQSFSRQQRAHLRERERERERARARERRERERARARGSGLKAREF
jgi:hypothetical protein